uniref:Probable rRNA maturation factor n=1 Tax=Zeugodacus cucurbitae TaxID=28588 RepID=A0A0A1XRP0_ZEUCU
MNAFVKISCIALLVFCCLAEAKYVPGVSYIDNVVLSYNNDIWRCDKLVCPANTYGCKIIKRNNPNRADELICNNICYDKDGKNLVKLTQTESMVKAKKIDIYINSYLGAQSVWSTGYSLSSQDVNATIAVADFPELQETTRKIMREVDESNAPWQRATGRF